MVVLMVDAWMGESNPEEPGTQLSTGYLLCGAEKCLCALLLLFILVMVFVKGTLSTSERPPYEGQAFSLFSLLSGTPCLAHNNCSVKLLNGRWRDNSGPGLRSQLTTVSNSCSSRSDSLFCSLWAPGTCGAYNYIHASKRINVFNVFNKGPLR